MSDLPLDKSVSCAECRSRSVSEYLLGSSYLSVHNLKYYRNLGYSSVNLEVCPDILWRDFTSVGLSCRLGFEPSSEQLQQVVRQADQVPLGMDFLQTAQQEPSEPASLFDLTKDRLNYLLSFRVCTAPPNRSQLS